MNLNKEFADMSDGGVLFVITNVDKIIKTNKQILNILLKDSVGVYVTVNEPYENLKKIMKRNNIDTKNMFFIDCITEHVGGSSRKTDKCLYISSPRSLTELSIAISEVMKSMPGKKKFLLLDTLSTLLVYNSPSSIAKFSHFSSTRLKLLGDYGVFITIYGQMGDSLVKQISQFCDKTVKVE